mmetsp:Transcript_15213/g.49933  ORF Transcript_15213/g.49933 Transcript_15213/m.49933 type:complete len:225 (+) Transcript_15213:115-789(+)
MGAGASTSHAPPELRNDGATLFSVRPSHADMLAKTGGPLALLEVGPDGFRLLRAVTEEPLFVFPFPQVHSWAHAPDRFSFRYFEDRSKSIKHYHFHMTHVSQLMDCIHGIINSILDIRKSKAMGEDQWATLLAEITAAPEDARKELVDDAVKINFFSSAQAKELVALLGDFDKTEGAYVLHGRLIDQNNFNTVLKELDSQTDRENVWHLIAQQRKKKDKGASSS